MAVGYRGYVKLSYSKLYYTKLYYTNLNYTNPLALRPRVGGLFPVTGTNMSVSDKPCKPITSADQPNISANQPNASANQPNASPNASW